MEFTLNINPPTVTAQERRVTIRNGRPRFYEGSKLKAARNLFLLALAEHRPEDPLEGPVALTVEWRFGTKSHREGSYRITRPDLDNLEKLLKDCMTTAGFWKDYSQMRAVNEYLERKSKGEGRR